MLVDPGTSCCLNLSLWYQGKWGPFLLDVGFQVGIVVYKLGKVLFEKVRFHYLAYDYLLASN